MEMVRPRLRPQLSSQRLQNSNSSMWHRCRHLSFQNVKRGIVNRHFLQDTAEVLAESQLSFDAFIRGIVSSNAGVRVAIEKSTCAVEI